MKTNNNKSSNPCQGLSLQKSVVTHQRHRAHHAWYQLTMVRGWWSAIGISLRSGISGQRLTSSSRDEGPERKRREKTQRKNTERKHRAQRENTERKHRKHRQKTQTENTQTENGNTQRENTDRSATQYYKVLHNTIPYYYPCTRRITFTRPFSAALLSYHLAVDRGWWSASNIIFSSSSLQLFSAIILLWSGVGGATSSCCGQGLVVKYATVLWKDPFATLSAKKESSLAASMLRQGNDGPFALTSVYSRPVGRTIFIFAWDVSDLWRIPPPGGGWRSLGCPGMKICDDPWLYVGLTDLDYILGHYLLVNGTTMIMWFLCAGEDELMRVRLFHPRFARLSYGWELIVVWFGLAGVGVFGFVFVGCVGLVVFLCWFCYSSRSVSFLVAFTQKMWRSSPVSVKGHWTCSSDLCH